MTLAAFCLAYAGFSALCLGMDRHYEDSPDCACCAATSRAIARVRLDRLGPVAHASATVWAALRHGRMDRHSRASPACRSGS